MKNKVQRKLYKLSSDRIVFNKYNITLNKDNTLDSEIVSISDNQILEFLRILKGITLEQEQLSIEFIKSEIRSKTCDIIKKRKELFDLIFIKELIFVTIDKTSHYRKLNKKLIINGVKYNRLYGTTGGVKNSTIIYIDEKYHDEVQRRINNGRDESIEFSAGKLSAYKSLTFTNSTKVSSPKNFIIVKDYKTMFKEELVIELDDLNTIYPEMKVLENYDAEVNDSDGYFVILPTYATRIAEELELGYTPSGFLFRNSFLKGMGAIIEFDEFAEKVAKTNIVIDAYGKERNIKEEEIEMIIPTSVFKLWSSYENEKEYIDNCNKNGYSFRVAKVAPEFLDNERNMNYQFIQPLDLSSEDIAELCSTTCNMVKDIVNDDPYKSIIFTKGIGLKNSNLKYGESDFTKALMIDKRMIDDPFVKTRIHDMIKKKINDAKIGVVATPANFQLIYGDVYGFLEHVFDIPETNRKNGLLNKNEVYSKYWIDKKIEDITIFRAPMSCHNNIRKVKVKSNKELEYWYKYMPNCMFLSSYDTITHALNGADKD